MQRRKFFKTTSMAAPVLLMACHTTETTGGKVNDEGPVTEKVKQAMLSMQRASWEQGVAAQAFLESGDKDMVILMAKEAVLRQQEDGRLSVLYTDNGVTDPAASGEAVLFAAEELNDDSMKTAARRMVSYLLNTKHKTDGILHHIRSGPEIWIDAMYMAPPFLAAAGEYEEAVKQIEGFRDALWNNEKKLYSHRWNAEEKVFVNEKFWGVGNGWSLAGISRVIDALPASFSEDKNRLISYQKEHLDSLLKYMRPDGYFHDVVNDPESFIETNLGQMAAYTIYRGIRAGWLDEEKFLSQAEKMRDAARKKVDEFGYVQDVCGAPYFNSPGRAAEGQAFFILMEAARSQKSS